MKPFWSKANKTRKSSVRTKSKPKTVPTPKKKAEPWKPPIPPKPPQTPPTYILPPPPKVPKPISKEPAPQPELKKVPPRLLTARKDFLKIFHSLTGHWRSWDIWTDFVTMAACSISNAVDKSHFDVREEMYLRIINKYNKQEQELFPKLLACTVLALEEDPEQDFLGDIYTELGLNSKERRQIFTPYDVCRFMAEITFGDLAAQVEEKGFVEINDCCCGAGATLIAAANVAKSELGKAGLNFQNHILISGQDIDCVAAMMCYIQLSLLGVAGYFKVGNSLTEPMADGDSLKNYWFTPMYFSAVWNSRRIFRQLDSLMKGETNESFKNA